MKKRVVGCLAIASVVLVGTATLACSDTALLWFVNTTLKDSHLTLDDLKSARQTAMTDCANVMEHALRRQCLLGSLHQQLRPSDTQVPAENLAPGKSTSI